MRLTERSLDYCTQHCPSEKMISCAFYKNDQAERCLIANMYDRLAAYEDTGLEPNAIEELLVKVPTWISVEDELPEESGYTIVYCTDGHINHRTFSKYQKQLKRWDLTGARSYWRVTHWMPLPEPPKVK